MSLLKTLTAGANELGLQLSADQLAQLVELQQQLIKWTKVYNLTSITDEQEVLKLHLLDSLAIVPFWSEGRFKKTIDVGTGAGFPGLPLAIALPHLEFHVLDSNSKKIRFIRQQIHQLGLTNVSAFHSRVQTHDIKDYDCVVSRAFASIKDMVEMTDPLLKAKGHWMAMKAAYTQDEENALPASVTQVNRFSLQVPGLAAERCLVELTRVND